MSPLWTPSPETIQNSQLTAFTRWLEKKTELIFPDYHSLWTWSVENTDAFWQYIFDYFDIIDHVAHTAITNGQPMPFTRWFEGSKINYAEHIFRKKTAERPAIIHFSESAPQPQFMPWNELSHNVASFQQYLISLGVKKGDRVAGFLTNTPHATIAMLATVSLGAIWSSCSPDFGVSSVTDRFQQIAPKVLIAVDGYYYNGKKFSKTNEVKAIQQELPSLISTVIVAYTGDFEKSLPEKSVFWDEVLLKHASDQLSFTPVDFNDPIWILYSSGTTGKPKAITHSHGGMLLEHLKYLTLHNDVHPGEKFFWFSTTGWMMWNFVHASLLAGATIVLYEGSPAYPSISMLWQKAAEIGIHHFGTSAPFIVACMKAGLDIKNTFDLPDLRSIGSTGSPLPPEGFDYVYDKISKNVWLTSMSGGTDVCTAFIGGNITLPVYEGQIQSRGLGCALHVFDESGRNLEPGKVGEMVITKPMPCMPVFFWNDQDAKKYTDSYFTMFEGIWRHGDWIEITQENGVIILGRSDATLNRHGVRIGTAEIYASINKIPEVRDSLIVNLELEGGRHYMPLFVVMAEGLELNDEIKAKINNQLKQDYSPRHCPDAIFQVDDLPYTISGKKLETPVKKILLGMPVDVVSNKDSVKNPESLEYFKKFKI
ncbi:MAG: acetoacetate--CoA ligase [Saprospiraceae bacterium]|nr:acetoacetate--CoA ligase [Saprospiraceae bacterium]